MNAKAAVAFEQGRVEFANVEVPEPTEEDVVVRLEHSWISNGTESSFIRGERIAGDTPRSKGDPMPFPHVSGYQKTGVVEWAGSAASGFRPGDRVFVSVSKINGMFYSYAGHVSPSVAHHSQVWRLPQNVSSLEASGLILTQVGYNIGIRPPILSGESVVVIGDGMVGHWAAQTMQSRGAKVILIGKHDYRLALFARKKGDQIFNISNLETPILDFLHLQNQIVVIADTAGALATVEALYPMMKREGQIISAGFYGNDGKIDIQKMRDRELTLQAPSGWTRQRVDSTLDLLSRGLLKTSHLITHRFPIKKAHEAFDLVLNRKSPALGIVLDW